MKATPWAVVVCLGALRTAASAATLQVGPGHPYTKPCAAIAAAADGDTILIEAIGNYNGDVCRWYTNNLTIRGVNGRPHIDAIGKSAFDKGIWVLEGDDTVIENVELSGAVSTSKNGAAVRLEGVGVTLRQVYFHNNQDGILANGVQAGEVLIEYSEFANNGADDGQSHNIYIGRIDKFTLQYSYSHAAIRGHLVKSRAANNYILFNRLTSEGANTSYEVDLPNGGLSYIVGNVIQQGPNDPNRTLISYLAEGTNPYNSSYDLFDVNNTLVNEQSSGTFIQPVSPANPATVANNIFAGAGTLVNQTSAILSNNLSGVNPMFVNPSGYDYHLQTGSPAIDAAADPGIGLGISLLPLYEYVHRTCGEVRNSVAAIDIGAFEFGGAGTPLACSISTAAPALSAMSLSPNPVIGGSGSATLTVSLTNTAPAGGITVMLSSSNGSVASTASSITIPAGSYSASTAVHTGGVVSATSVTITASYAGVNRSATLKVNPPSALNAVNLSPTTVGGGKTSKLVVTLTSAAPSNGVVVLLSSSNATAAPVPASVTVPGGATSASINIVTQALETAASATLTASANGISKTATLQVVPPALSNVTAAVSSIVGGNSIGLTVTLTSIAPAGGVVVNLKSSDSTLAPVASSVTVPAGVSTVSTTVATKPVTGARGVTVTATMSGVIKSDYVVVEALLASISASPASVTGGTSATLTVMPNGAAPAGGIYVTLNTSAPAAATTPTPVFVPAGATSARATVTTFPVSASTPVTLSASYASATRSTTLTVN